MATGNTQINNSDPAILRQLERQTATTLIRPAAVPGTTPASGNTTTTAGAVRNLAPVVSGSDVVYPQSTTATSNNSVTVTSSINNDSGDVTTVYATNGAITVNPVNQTINQYTSVDSGVSQILAGNGVTITSTGASGTGVVTINTSTVALGNIVSVNLDGNSANVLHGDGSWSADQTTYGNSNVAAYLPTYTGNIGGNVVTANLFAGNGSSLSAIAGANVSGFVPNANVANTAFAVAGANVSGFVPNANVANTAFSIAAANVSGLGNIATVNLDGNVSNLLTGNGTYVAIPVVPTVGNIATINLDGNSQTWLAGNGVFANIAIPTVGNIATINLDGSTSNVLYGNGVFAAVAGGANTGNVTFDDVTVQGDNNSLNLSAGSDFTANLAYLQVRAGDVASHIHLDTGNNDAYDLIVGDDQNYVQVSSTGNILLSSYDSNTAQYIWTLDYNGNLILAGGNSVIQSIANSSLDPTLPNVSTMVFTPDANYNSQILVLDPTAPGHIHLRAYAFSNIDEPAANIFLGGEDTAFEITSGANNEARIHSGGNTWTFGNDGRLTFPGTPRIDTATNNFEVQAAEAISLEANTVVNIYTDVGNNAYQWQFGDDGNLILPDTASVIANASITLEANSTGNITGLSVNGDADANLYAHSNVNIVSDGGNREWTFDTTGTLTAPGDITVAGDITGTAGANTLILKAQPNTNTSIQLNSIVDSTIRIDANLEIITDSSNTSQSWNFDIAGNLTLPGNTLAINYANGDAAFGNIVSVNVDGNTSNVLLGNGVFASIPSPTTIANGNSNVSIATANGNVTISAVGNTTMTVTGTGANVTGTLTSTGKIGYASGSTVTQITSRGTGVTINALAGTIVTTSAAMVATEIDTFSVINSSVDPNNDIVLAQIVSPNQGTYDCIANPAVIGGFNDGFYLNIVNISGFTTADETITIRFMVIKAPNA